MARKRPLLRPSKRSRLQTTIHADVLAQVRLYCARQGWHESAFFETASLQLLDGTGDKALLYRRIESTHRRIDRVVQQVDIALELLSLYIQLWLHNTPPLPKADKQATTRQAAAAYQRLLEQLGRNLSSGKTFVDALPKEPLTPAAADEEPSPGAAGREPGESGTGRRSDR